MKIVGGILIGVGVLLFFIARAIFMKAFSLSGNRLLSRPINLNESVKTDLVQVKTDKQCRVAVAMNVESSSVNEEEWFDEKKYTMRFKFPMKYQILDEGGNVLHSEDSAAAWDQGTRVTSGAKTGPGAGKAKIEFGFEEFKVGPPGKIRVEATLSADDEFKATARNIRLSVFDDVAENLKDIANSMDRMFKGFWLIMVGPLLVFLGLVIFVIGLFV